MTVGPRANTSHVERHNLTVRMSVRRFTRLTNAFLEEAGTPLPDALHHFYHYNWCRPNSAVRMKGNNRVTPAMAAGLADRPATLEELVALVDARTPKPNRPKTYKKRPISN